MIHSKFLFNHEVAERYERDGFYRFPHFLTSAALDDLRGNLQKLMEETAPGQRTDQYLSPHQLGARWLLELGMQTPILDMIEEFVGPDIVLWSATSGSKPPGGGQEIPWHQDRPYWNVTGTHAPGIWIPLDDVDESNGTMRVLPGWHDKGELPIRRFAPLDAQSFNQDIDPSAMPDNLDELVVPYELRAGQAAIHHTMLPHHSYPNGSDRWRRVLGLRYISADGEMGPAQYTSHLDGQPFTRRGVLVRGQDKHDRGWLRPDELPSG